MSDVDVETDTHMSSNFRSLAWDTALVAFAAGTFGFTFSETAGEVVILTATAFACIWFVCDPQL